MHMFLCQSPEFSSRDVASGKEGQAELEMRTILNVQILTDYL